VNLPCRYLVVWRDGKYFEISGKDWADFLLHLDSYIKRIGKQPVSIQQLK